MTGSSCVILKVTLQSYL